MKSEEPTLGLCELSLLHTSLDGAVELGIERCARSDILIVCKDVLFKSRATVLMGCVSKMSIEVTRPQR